MGRPRNANAELTRQRILDAAIRRFAADGLEGTSLRAIGGDVGVPDSGVDSPVSSV